MKVAVAPVERFHWFDEINWFESSKTRNSAVFGPELPWFRAVKSTLLNPLVNGSLKPANFDSKNKL